MAREPGTAGPRRDRDFQPQLLRGDARRARAPRAPGGATHPGNVGHGSIWEERFEDINAYERYLSRNGVAIRKFFLHVSPEEQKKRFLERLEEPEKHWKFASSDITEREFFDDYIKAYEELIQQTSTKDAPWYVVPADHKWFTRAVVSDAIVETIKSLHVDFPKLSGEERKKLAASREKLLSEGWKK
ncbi:MAG TPA: hypothetical protein VF614_14110 [Chthoniobacteraceae bacterium]